MKEAPPRNGFIWIHWPALAERKVVLGPWEPRQTNPRKNKTAVWRVREDLIKRHNKAVCVCVCACHQKTLCESTAVTHWGDLGAESAPRLAQLQWQKKKTLKTQRGWACLTPPPPPPLNYTPPQYTHTLEVQLLHGCDLHYAQAGQCVRLMWCGAVTHTAGFSTV